MADDDSATGRKTGPAKPGPDRRLPPEHHGTMRLVRLDRSLVAQLQAALPKLLGDREELRGSVGGRWDGEKVGR